MGDTKRGREQKGEVKREQLRRREITETLNADEEPPKFEEEDLYLESEDEDRYIESEDEE